jgi:hypothetical protein
MRDREKERNKRSISVLIMVIKYHIKMFEDVDWKSGRKKTNIFTIEKT